MIGAALAMGAKASVTVTIDGQPVVFERDDCNVRCQIRYRHGNMVLNRYDADWEAIFDTQSSGTMGESATPQKAIDRLFAQTCPGCRAQVRLYAIGSQKQCEACRQWVRLAPHGRAVSSEGPFGKLPPPPRTASERIQSRIYELESALVTSPLAHARTSIAMLAWALQLVKAQEEQRSEQCEISGTEYTFAYWGIDAHDGAGWYYFETEYGDEGSIGRFGTLEAAKAHARKARGFTSPWRSLKDAAHRGRIVVRNKHQEHHIAEWTDVYGGTWHTEGCKFYTLDEFERRWPEFMEVPS